MELLVVSGLIDSFMNDSRQYYSEACSAVLTCMMECLAKAVNEFLSITIFVKRSILDV